MASSAGAASASAESASATSVTQVRDAIATVLDQRTLAEMRGLPAAERGTLLYDI